MPLNKKRPKQKKISRLSEHVRGIPKSAFQALAPDSKRNLEWLCQKCNEEFKRPLVKVFNCPTDRVVCEQCRKLKAVQKLEETNKKKYGTLTDLPKRFRDMFADDLNTVSISHYNLRSTKKVYFRCTHGHVFKRSIGAFADNQICPKCNRQTSKIEIRIFAELSLFFSDLLWQHKIEGHEFDIYSPKYKFAIEVDGEFWHKDKNNLDIKKNKIARDLEFCLIRFRFGDMKKIGITYIASSDKERDYQVQFAKFCDYLLTQNCPTQLKKICANWLSVGTFKADEVYTEIFSRLPGPPEKQSLQSIYPNLSAEWSSLNLPLTPDKIWPNSDTVYFWECNESEYHPAFQSTPGKRIRGDGCPCCSGRKLAFDNSLEYLKPIVAKRWNFKKNHPTKPSDVLAGSTKSYWMICENGHEWQDRLYDIKNSEKSRPCKKCMSLGFKFPELAKEWMSIKNKVDSFSVHAGSNKNFWWKCSKCGNEFEQSPSTRTINNYGCPNHRVEKAVASKASKRDINETFGGAFPKYSEYWDFKKNKDSPFDLGKKSDKKRYFLCKCGASITRILSSVSANGKKDRAPSCRC